MPSFSMSSLEKGPLKTNRGAWTGSYHGESWMLAAQDHCCLWQIWASLEPHRETVSKFLEALIFSRKRQRRWTHFICELAQIMLELGGDGQLGRNQQHLTAGKALKRSLKKWSCSSRRFRRSLMSSSGKRTSACLCRRGDGYIDAAFAYEHWLFTCVWAGRAVKSMRLD